MSTSTRESHETQHRLRHPLLALPFRHFHRHRMCRVHRMYAACLCPAPPSRWYSQPPTPIYCAKSSSLTRACGLTATRPRQTFEGHRRQLHQSIGSEAVPESDREDDHPSRSGQPSPDGSLEAREREDSVGLLSPLPSQQSPRASVLGSCSCSATSLALISGAFCSLSRSRNTSSGSGSGSSGNSRHSSHVSVSSASLALGRACAQSYPWHWRRITVQH